jgi:deoxycytidine triphosphate deaminase
MNTQKAEGPDGILVGTDIAASLSTLMAGGNEDCVESCSYDMRVGTIFDGNSRIAAGSTHTDKNLQVQPGQFVYIYTLEELTLPSDVSATAYAINALSSRGFLVLNPGHVDPGFRGPLTVTAWNLNNKPQLIEVGERIITVLLARLPKAARPYARNVPRDKRERDFTRHVSTDAARSIADLIQHNTLSPIATKADLEELRQSINGSIANRLTILAAILSVVLGLSGLTVAIIPLIQSVGQRAAPATAASSAQR